MLYSWTLSYKTVNKSIFRLMFAIGIHNFKKKKRKKNMEVSVISTVFLVTGSPLMALSVFLMGGQFCASAFAV